MISSLKMLLPSVLLEGDAQYPTWELMRAVREYQTRQGGHFGTTESDLQRAFYFFGTEQAIFKDKEYMQPLEKIFSMPFSTWIPIILKEYQTFYCNDEGESFKIEPDPVPCWRRKSLLACFAGTPTPGEVQKLLVELGWSINILEFFLEGRAGYWEEDSPVEEIMTHILRLR